MAVAACVAVKVLGLLALVFVFVLLVTHEFDDNNIAFADPERQVTRRRNEETTRLYTTLPPPYTDDLTFVFNNNVCTLSSAEENITAIILVHSHAGKLEQRALMRSTFPSTTLAAVNLRRVFVLASLDDGVERNKRYPSVSNAKLLEESRLYGDTVQCSYVEGYYKIIYKNLMGLRWATEYCPQARFVAKMDDDNLVNYYKVAEVLNNISVADEDLFMGAEWRKTEPRRNKSSRYYISYEEYAPKILPNYLSGLLYWTSMASTKKLLAAAKEVPFFKADDVYLTGMVANKAGVRRKDFKAMMSTVDLLGCCKNVTSGEMFECKYMIGMNQQQDNSLLRKISEHIEYCRRTECSPPLESMKGLQCF